MLKALLGLAADWLLPLVMAAWLQNLPRQWRDDKHEPDGTAFSHIAVEPTTATANPLTPEQIIRGPLQFTT